MAQDRDKQWEGALVLMEILDHVNNCYVSFFVATFLFYFFFIYFFAYLDECLILCSINNSNLNVGKVKLHPTVGHEGTEGE